MSDQIHNEPVTLIEAATSFEAHAIAAVLRDAGIDALVAENAHAAVNASLRGTRQGVAIKVRADDLDDARSALAENEEVSRMIDWSDVEVGDRADDLPLRSPGRMPLLARVAFAATALVMLIALAALVIVLVW